MISGFSHTACKLLFFQIFITNGHFSLCFLYDNVMITLSYSDCTIPLFIIKYLLNSFTTHIQSSGQSGPEFNLFLDNASFIGRFESKCSVTVCATVSHKIQSLCEKCSVQVQIGLVEFCRRDNGHPQPSLVSLSSLGFLY